jgi:hypothetical protein
VQRDTNRQNRQSAIDQSSTTDTCHGSTDDQHLGGRGNRTEQGTKFENEEEGQERDLTNQP